MNIEEQNPWWQGEPDEMYNDWLNKPIKWIPKFIDIVPLTPFGLNFLTGPRQVGKSTALKLLIHKELDKGANPYSFFYCPCDELLNYDDLGEILDLYISTRDARKIIHSLIVLDEITFVKEWWRAVKLRIDNGKIKNDTLIISGSSSIELLQEKERFPGRRGNGRDFLLHPLSFHEYAALSIQGLLTSQIDHISSIEDTLKPNIIFNKTLETLFNNYLKTGGFPLPIHDFFNQGKVRNDTKRTYLDWIRGDIKKEDKSEGYFKEIIAYLLKVHCSPISWLSIAKETSINSPHTTQSYIEMFEKLYIVNVLNFIAQDGKINFKKNKKVHFIDPFLVNLLSEYTNTQILNENLVEGVVANHISRVCPVFYWKNSSEIDIIGLINKEQVGFEVKWGPKKWKKPIHLKKSYLLTKEIIPNFLASIDWNANSKIE